jgi:hypothetical protein
MTNGDREPPPEVLQPGIPCDERSGRMMERFLTLKAGGRNLPEEVQPSGARKSLLTAPQPSVSLTDGNETSVIQGATEDARGVPPNPVAPTGAFVHFAARFLGLPPQATRAAAPRLD